MKNSSVLLFFMDTLLLLLSPQLLIGLVYITHAPFSKRSKIIFFLQFSHEFGGRGTQQYTVFFYSLVKTATGVKIEVSKFIVISG